MVPTGCGGRESQAMKRLKHLWRWLTDHRPLRLTIVRRYPDANDNFIGELYALRDGAYKLIGVSLDSLAMSARSVQWPETRHVLDTAHVFTDPMPSNRLRVGHSDPSLNDGVRRMVDETPRRNITIVIQNRFIEWVLGPKPVKKSEGK